MGGEKGQLFFFLKMFLNKVWGWGLGGSGGRVQVGWWKNFNFFLKNNLGVMGVGLGGWKFYFFNKVILNIFRKISVRVEGGGRVGGWILFLIYSNLKLRVVEVRSWDWVGYRLWKYKKIEFFFVWETFFFKKIIIWAAGYVVVVVE